MKISVALLLLGAVLVLASSGTASAQTFQYSRGWTNGRKRSGGEDNQQMQLQQRAVETLARRLFPYGSWPGAAKRGQPPSDLMAELARAVSTDTNDCQFLKSCPDSSGDVSSPLDRNLIRNFELPLLSNEFDNRPSD